MAFQSGAGFVFSVDIGAGPVELETTGVSESINEVIDTFYLLSNSGMASNSVVGIDPQFDVTVKLNVGDVVFEFLYALRYTTDRTVPIAITDNTVSPAQTLTFSGELTSFPATRDVAGVVEFPLSFKVASGTIVIT